MPNGPSVTHPNLVKSQISMGIGSVLGGEGRVGVEWWHEHPRSDQNSPAGPTCPVQQLCSQRSSGSGVPLSPIVTPLRQLRSQKSGSRGTTAPLKLYFCNRKTGKV